MERASDRGAVIGLATAQHRTAVGTCVDQCIELAVFGASDHDWLTANVGGVVVANIWNLGFVREEDPVAFEDVAHFQVKKFLVGKHLAVDANNAFFRTVVQCVFQCFINRITARLYRHVYAPLNFSLGDLHRLHGISRRFTPNFRCANCVFTDS